MAYDEDLVNRIREILSSESGIDERRMFGALAFLLHGNMAVAASREGDLMVRVSPDDTTSLLEDPRVSPMIMAGREARGWVRVSSEGVASMPALRTWVHRGVKFARTLPPRTSLPD